MRRGQRAKLAETLTHHLKAIVDDVLTTRASGKPRADAIAPSHAVVASLSQMSSHGETPVIVPGPRLVMKLVTAEAATTGSVIPGSISSIRPKFIPARYSEHTPETNSKEWFEFDPPRFAQGKPNPESQWYLRVLRSGALDGVITVGERIDDDKDILADIEPLEARVVEMAKRMGDRRWRPLGHQRGYRMFGWGPSTDLASSWELHSSISEPPICRHHLQYRSKICGRCLMSYG